MNYALAKELKEAGFPQKPSGMFPLWIADGDKEPMQVPTLEELIEACGDHFLNLTRAMGPTQEIIWEVNAFKFNPADGRPYTRDTTAEAAVARLWLALNRPDKASKKEL